MRNHEDRVISKNFLVNAKIFLKNSDTICNAPQLIMEGQGFSKKKFGVPQDVKSMG